MGKPQAAPGLSSLVLVGTLELDPPIGRGALVCRAGRARGETVHTLEGLK